MKWSSLLEKICTDKWKQRLATWLIHYWPGAWKSTDDRRGSVMLSPRVGQLGLGGGWKTRSPPEESGVEKLWDARGALSGRWETSVPAFKLANDGLSTGSKSNWIVQESPETGAANRFVLFLTSLNIIWILLLTHTCCWIYALQQKILGPNKSPNMALTGLLMKKGGYARHRLLNWWNSFEFPSLAARWPAPNTVNPIHHNFCPQFSRVLAVREIRGYRRAKIGFGQTLKGFVSLPGGMKRLSCFLSFL